MAQSLYQFDIDDDSPEIAYFPFVNLEPSSDVSAGWELLYSVSGVATGPGQVGVGSSSHYTSLDGASLLISWNGTGIVLIGSVSNALYNISLDGLPSAYSPDPSISALASFNGLQNTNHSLLLTTIITNSTSPDAFLTFDKATITYAPPAGFLNTTATSQTIADSDIAFMGQWNYITDSAGNSVHMSNSAGDRAEATFSGSAITIYGLISSYSGNFTVSLDNITTNLSALSSYNDSNSLLFYATDLSQDMLHHIAVINQENNTFALRAGGMNITSFGNETTSPTNSSSSSSLPAGTIAAIVLAVVLFLVITGVFCYVCCIRRKASTQRPRNFSDEKRDTDTERVNGSPRSGEELESTSLSTSKGYGFGLGLRRGPLFVSLKNKIGSSSSAKSRNVAFPQTESHLMAPPRDRDEKRLSIFTLTEDLPVLVDAPESEKLAPGWSYPAAHPPWFLKHSSRKDTQDLSLPELRVVGPADDEDADVKTLTSRQDEALAVTFLLSPRTSEVAPAIDGRMAPELPIDTQDIIRHSHENQQPEFLQVRDTSPFRVDMSAIFGTRNGGRDSKRSSGSGNSTWSKVRSRLYRRAHRDDGRQSGHADRQESSGSSGPESVPVVMHESNPPTEPGSGTYSFLDLTASRVSLRRHSKTTTLSSTPAEVGHGAREVSGRSEDTSIRMVRIERSRDALAPKPDAPSTASGGSPSDKSANLASPSAPTTHTQTSSHFLFPITIPSSQHIAQPLDNVPEYHVTPSPPRTPPSSPQAQYLQIPKVAPRELALTFANSPTESVPFSVSDIHFRHSFSDYATPDSRRASASSVLPPHPPLPHLEDPQANTPTFAPYIVQRVLGLPVSPISPFSPILPSAFSRTQTLDNRGNTLSGAVRPGTAPTGPSVSRVSSLLGPRPRPSTAGSVRVSAAPQLPMQGGRSNMRGGPR